MPAEPVAGRERCERNTRKATAVKDPETSTRVGISTCQDSRLSGESPSNSMSEPSSSDTTPATLSSP